MYLILSYRGEIPHWTRQMMIIIIAIARTLITMRTTINIMLRRNKEVKYFITTNKGTENKEQLV